MPNHSVDYVGTKARVKLNGDCLKQEQIMFNYGKLLNIYIVYDIERSVNVSSYPTLKNCLNWCSQIKKNLLTLICTNIQNMVSDLIEKVLIHLVMKSVEM